MGRRRPGRRKRRVRGKSGVCGGENRRNGGEGEGKESLTDPIPILLPGPPGRPAVTWQLSFPEVCPTRGPALHTLCAGRGLISSFYFAFLPGRKWFHMLWVGPHLAVLTLPRFLMIPGDRAGTTNQPQRGAEPCLRTPHTPGNLSHPRALGARRIPREML